jgi:glycosyltransferase involved in cell wall biosynthesis
VSASHIVLLHGPLAFSGATRRLLISATLLHERGFKVSVLAAPGTRAPSFEQAGIAVFETEPGSANPHNPFVARRMARKLRELKPDLLHVTGAGLAATGADLAARLHLPYILEIGRPVTGRIQREANLLKAVVLTCATLTEGIVNRGRLPRDLLRVVEHGPTTPAGERPPRTGDSPTVIGCSGYLDRDHGTDLFLEAARLISLTGRRARFLVLGEGPCEQDLRHQAREAAIEHLVTITAPASPDTLRLLAEMDLHVNCSRECGPGWLAHEALALGLPSVLTAVSSAFALVEDGVSGLLVEREDPQRLAQAITRLLDDPSAARAMGLEARARLLARCDDDSGGGSYARDLPALYEDLLPMPV